MPKEVECRCNKCNHEWSYSVDEEKNVKQKAQMGGLICDDGICGNPYGNQILDELMNAENEVKKFKICPKCKSEDIKKRIP